MGSFEGIRPEAADFFAELETPNERGWWLANKARHDELVKAPFAALAEQLADYGPVKVFRPHRDVRFSHDKSPYKTHQGLFVARGEHTGWYFQLDATGITLGGGSYHLSPRQLTAYRAAVTNDATGVQLEEVLRELEQAGYQVGGEQLATRPRGVDADAPRLDLLRRKALHAALPLGLPDWMATSELAGYVRDGWDELEGLVEWLAQLTAAPQPGH